MGPIKKYKVNLSPSASEIWQALIKWAPVELAESWDNIGLQVGDPALRVKRILVALDPTEALLKEAERKDVQMVITHHPLIFSPIRSVDLSHQIPRLLAGFLRSNIVLFAAHTNLDSAKGGVSDMVAGSLGLCGVRPLVISAHGDPATGIGRVGRLARPTALSVVASSLLSLLSAPDCLMTGNLSQPIKKIAICCGSGSDLWPYVIASGAELFISAEIKHHIARDAEERGIAIIDAGHFYTERPIVFEIMRFLRQWADKMSWVLELYTFDAEGPPLRRMDGPLKISV